MSDFRTPALFEILSAEERARLRHTVAEDADLAHAALRWEALRTEVRNELARSLPNPELLVLFALSGEAIPGEAIPGEATSGEATSEGGRLGASVKGALTAADRRRLANHLPALRDALRRHPGMRDAVRHLRRDRALFESVWEASSVPQNPAGSVSPVRASSRREVRRTTAGLVKEGAESPAHREGGSRPAVPPATRSPARRWAWRTVALLAVVAFGTLLGSLLLRDAGFETVHVAERQTLTLPDGTNLKAAPGTKVRIPTRDALREVRVIAGQLVLNVAHDPEAPFIVQTPGARVTVLGTTFGVEASETLTTVILVSGAVTLTARGEAGDPVRLAPGQSSRVMGREAPSRPRLADVNETLGWTGDVFADGEPLSEVAGRIEKQFGVTVRVAPELAGERITGVFHQDEGAADALRKLALTLGANVEGSAARGFRLLP